MQAVRSKNNKAEGLLSRTLWAMGFRYRKYRRDLPGHPDIVFAAQKVAVFVDGDFWHARIYLRNGIVALRRSLRTERAAWWVEKLRSTAVRDRRVTQHLRAMGFIVVRVWERDVLHDPDSIAARVARIVRNRTTGSLT
jgi:DNA mismatch endonuclease (patch repair protein)